MLVITKYSWHLDTWDSDSTSFQSVIVLFGYVNISLLPTYVLRPCYEYEILLTHITRAMTPSHSYSVISETIRNVHGLNLGKNLYFAL